MAQSSVQSSKFDPYEHFHIAMNPDGSLSRFTQMPTAPVTGDEENEETLKHNVLCKDITLSQAKKTYIRVYRPIKISSKDHNKVPIVISFHTGGFILFNPDTTLVHDSCNKFAKEIPAIIVSVAYRLAPESRLPAQYEDAIDGITWVRDQALKKESGDPWLRDYGDFSRVYLYGASAGGNIAFNAALRILDLDMKPMKVVGTIMNQPLFGGKKRTKSELKLATDAFFPLPAVDLLWELALPKGTDRDHRFCNPLIDGATRDKIKNLGRTLVIGFGGDPLIDRQQAFVQMLALQGTLVEARFDDVGFHCIDIIDSRRAAAILSFVKEFVV